MTNPRLPPLLVNKASSVFYVYTYKNVWDRDLKQKDGVICFNGGFLQERPEFRNFLVERKGEEYICTPLNESGTTLTQPQ